MESDITKYKKLSYRKQIARQLCIQYVEGIYSNSVTLKSGLEPRGHSLEMVIGNGTIWKLWYGFLFAFHIATAAVFLSVYEIFSFR